MKKYKVIKISSIIVLSIVFFAIPMSIGFVEGTYTLTVSTQGNGQYVASPSGQDYPAGTVVRLIASGDYVSKNVFDRWSGDIPQGQDRYNPIYITMDSNKNIGVSFIPDDGSGITVGPYLQPTGGADPDINTGELLYSDGTERLRAAIGVAFRTANPSSAVIHYGISDENEYSIILPDIDTKHFIKLTDLEPGTTYRYYVEGDNDTSPVYEFKTSPPDGRFKVLVGADFHSIKPQAVLSLSSMLPDMLKFDPDVIFLQGDIVASGTLTNYTDMFFMFRELYATAVYVHITGGHERDCDSTEGSGAGLARYREFNYFPENGPDDKKEVIFSFDYGKAHFVSYGEWGLSLTYNAWGEQDLIQARARDINYIFTGRHGPVYGDGGTTKRSLVNTQLKLSHTDLETMRLYDTYDVDIQFSGHWHIHERTYPLIRNPIDPKQWGIICSQDAGYYNANCKGTIYHLCQSGVDGLGIAHNSLYNTPPGDGKVSYIEMTVEDKKCTVETYGYQESGTYTARRASRNLRDKYIIDKNDTTLNTPFISDVSVAELTSERAVITWDSKDSQNNALATRGQIEFGTTAGRYPYIDMRGDQNQVFKSSHRLALNCLKPNTTYYYRVKSWREGEEAISDEYSFTTPALSDAGELVGEFDFGPLVCLPQGTRVSLGLYDAKIRNGWSNANVNYYYNYDYNYNNAYLDADNSFCYVANNTLNTWSTDLPNGEYDVNITVGRGRASGNTSPLTFFGDTHIVLEPGTPNEIILDALKPNDPANTLWVWPAKVKVTDGRLDVRLGYGTPGHDAATMINRLTIWVPGGETHMPPDTTPPVANAGEDKTVKLNTAVSFDGSGSSDNVGAVSYLWDFDYDPHQGFQADARGVNPTFTFIQVRDYIVALSVDDAAGNGPVIDTAKVTVMPNSVSILSLRDTPDPFSPNGDGVNETTMISGKFNQSVVWTIEIKDAADQTVRSFSGLGANLAVKWNGRNVSGVLLPDGTYTYILTGTGPTGDSASQYGTTVLKTVLPAAPSNLIAQALSSTQIRLTWQDDSADETGFRIEQSMDGVTFAYKGYVTANKTTYTAGGLASGKTYYYRVCAYRGNEKSKYSNTAFGTTQ
ncbi:MAG: fibronectin type III domain-containing protein [Candidatus Omnitrophica bacterium]|nr:fibronectin type III domain-containing protein [Candidatus Omnitrophota bacterium]